MVANTKEYTKYLKWWKTFIETGAINKNIRACIADSWQRSKAYEVDPEEVPSLYLSEEEYYRVVCENQDFLEVVSSMFKSMEGIFNDSSSVLMLADRSANILEILSGEQNHNIFLPFLREGIMFSEKYVGTNAITLALNDGKPVKVMGPEHYNAYLHSWSCTAVPIMDQRGVILGAFSLSVPYQMDQEHTFGMMLSLAKAIEKELAMRDKVQKMDLVNEFFNHLSYKPGKGLILVDEKGSILKVNSKASEVLSLGFHQLIDKSITYYFSDLDLDKLFSLKQKKVDMDLNLQKKQGKCQVKADIEIIRNQQEAIGAIVCLDTYGKEERKKSKETKYTFSDIIGENVNFRNSVYIAKRTAESDVKVLLQGESGTGKEVFAQAIHNMSDRCDGPFVAINCGAIPPSLVESELFGYESGAFTGAKPGGQKGKFELAQGGTLFLDEIGELSLEMQAKLLRVLEENKLRRVGGNKLIDIDVRIIAATNLDLEQEVKEKRFRDDLYYRLAVVTIYIPPLRERKDDLPHLINYFVYHLGHRLHRHIEYIHPEVQNLLHRYHWPGNIRELENVIERLILLGEDNQLLPDNLPPKLKHLVENTEILQEEVEKDEKEIRSSSGYVSEAFYRSIPKEAPQEEAPDSLATMPTINLKELEKAAITKALKETQNNISHAAKILGIGRNTLYRKIRDYQIEL